MGITNVSGFQRRRRELAAKQAVEKVAENKSIHDMTVAELKQYAADHEIDLGDATKKADILEMITAHKGEGDGEE